MSRSHQRVAKGRFIFGRRLQKTTSEPQKGVSRNTSSLSLSRATRATGCVDAIKAGPCPYRGPGQDRAIWSSPCPCRLPARHPGHPNALGRERPALDCVSRPSDRRGPGRDPGAAMCVQGIDVQCVLQFTLINAAGCALHRCTSRVIHRSELSFQLVHGLPPGPPGSSLQRAGGAGQDFYC